MPKVVLLRTPARRPAERQRSKSRLTKRYVEEARPSARETLHWDGELRGFGLRVMPSGIRAYFIQYRDRGGHTRKLALGRHGVITAEQAREMARQHLAAVARGENPSVDRKRDRHEARHAQSVGAVIEEFLDFVEKRRKPTTFESYRNVADTRILKRLGDRPAKQLSHDDVRSWHASMAATPYGANRGLAILSAAFGHARLPSPCVGVERFPEKARDRFLSLTE